MTNKLVSPQDRSNDSTGGNENFPLKLADYPLRIFYPRQFPGKGNLPRRLKR